MRPHLRHMCFRSDQPAGSFPHPSTRVVQLDEFLGLSTVRSGKPRPRGRPRTKSASRQKKKKKDDEDEEALVGDGGR